MNTIINSQGEFISILIVILTVVLIFIVSLLCMNLVDILKKWGENKNKKSLKEQKIDLKSIFCSDRETNELQDTRWNVSNNNQKINKDQKYRKKKKK